MRVRLSHWSIWQTTLVACINYFIITFILYALGTIVSLVQGQGADALWLLLFPFVSTLFVAIIYPIALWVYNRVAGWVGGVEFDLEQREGQE